MTLRLRHMPLETETSVSDLCDFLELLLCTLQERKLARDTFEKAKLDASLKIPKKRARNETP